MRWFGHMLSSSSSYNAGAEVQVYLFTLITLVH